MVRPTGLSWLYFVLMIWLAHTLGYLGHEYAHALLAWILGYKTNPLALDYGHLSFDNIVYLSDVDENVDYAPIFQADKGYLAALIAVAGVLFGNGIFYLVSRWLYAFAKKHSRPWLGLFAFLLCLMNVGNFLSYVPIRTFTNHADMATVAQGLSISPWWIAIVIGTPFAVAIYHFFVRWLPDAQRFVFPQRTFPQIILAAFCCYAVFDFFGATGLHRYGEVSHVLSAISLYVFFPVAFALCLLRTVGYRRLARTATRSA